MKINKESALFKLRFKRAKEMVANLEAKGKESAREFLPIYNYLTGRNEKGSCSTCWAARVKVLKKVIEKLDKEIEQHEIFVADADAKSEALKKDTIKKAEAPAAPAKKKRGMPKTKK
jgi:hypothetical protein